MSAAQTIRDYLAEHEIEHREIADGVFSITLPGEKKLQTPVRLDVGGHALGVHAFVCRTPDELDRLLGSVLTYADESFNTILELGFASSIRKEWEWRVSRGESTKNLEAFRGWLESDTSDV